VAPKTLKVFLTPMAEADLKHWQKSNPKVLLKINKLVQSAIQTPESGIGHPEKLTGQLSGAWSRRITAKDRLVYYIEADTLVITQARFHYERE
jgi:toxin YoeB